MSKPDFAKPSIPGYQILEEVGSRDGCRVSGSVFDTYDLPEWLFGEGRLYRARQLLDDAVVLLGVCQPYEHERRHRLEHLHAEGTTLLRARHPHVLRMFTAGVIGGQLYFALEWIDGPSLERVLRDGRSRPSAPASALLVQRLASIVAELHERGVVHGSLQPRSILLRYPLGAWEDAEPVLWDFRRVQLLRPPNDPEFVPVLPMPLGYLTPEAIQGHPPPHQPTPAFDQYTLGALLYQLLTGEPPYKRSSMMESLMAVMHEDLKPPRQFESSVPRDLDTIVLKSLEKEPAQRYASAGELADDLERFLSGEPIGPGAVRPPWVRLARAVRRWWRRRREA
jgi:serine/threonine protein kinase